MGNYRNFDLVVYFISDGVAKATRDKLQQDIDFFKKQRNTRASVPFAFIFRY